MKNDRHPIILRLFLMFFIFCFIMIFVVDFKSAEFYVMILSSLVNLIMVFVIIIKIRKENKNK